jgi:hypothetical protein
VKTWPAAVEKKVQEGTHNFLKNTRNQNKVLHYIGHHQFDRHDIKDGLFLLIDADRSSGHAFAEPDP